VILAALTRVVPADFLPSIVGMHISAHSARDSQIDIARQPTPVQPNPVITTSHFRLGILFQILEKLSVAIPLH
jgi:hypothetical protein